MSSSRASVLKSMLAVVDEIIRLLSAEPVDTNCLIKNVERERKFFGKLREKLVRYENMETRTTTTRSDDLASFCVELETTRDLIGRELNNKNKKNTQTVRLIDMYLSAVRLNYHAFRDYVQTLEDIMTKMDKKLVNKPNEKVKMGGLIRRGVEEKLPHRIIDGTDEKKRAEVVYFYILLIFSIFFFKLFYAFSNEISTARC